MDHNINVSHLFLLIILTILLFLAVLTFILGGFCKHSKEFLTLKSNIQRPKLKVTLSFRIKIRHQNDLYSHESVPLSGLKLHNSSCVSDQLYVAVSLFMIDVIVS
jgi:hypothetical protein